MRAMKLVRLILIALLSLAVPALGQASIVAATPCCTMDSSQQRAMAEEQDHCAEMGDAHASGGGDTQSHNGCNADGKCGACSHASSALTHSSTMALSAATPAAALVSQPVLLSHDPEGLWHPPRSL